MDWAYDRASRLFIADDTTLTIDSGAGTVQGTVRVRVDRKTGGPPTLQVAGALLVFRVLHNGVPTANFTYGGAAAFAVGGMAYTTANFPKALSGPFLVTDLTDAAGFVSFGFSASGFRQGDVMSLNLEAIGLPTAGHTTQNPDMTTITKWSMPDTPAFDFPGDGRCLDVTF